MHKKKKEATQKGGGGGGSGGGERGGRMGASARNCKKTATMSRLKISRTGKDHKKGIGGSRRDRVKLRFPTNFKEEKP